MSNNTNSIGTQYFPPGVACFTPQGEGLWDPTVYLENNCSVTPDMVNFLNLTNSISNYIAAYCLTPPVDDSCPFGYCPLADIAGPLVRISTYLTTLCISILIFYSPNRVKDSFYSQLLTIYSLLLTGGISIIQMSITRFHTITVSVIVCSPLSIYLVFCAIHAIWSDGGRLKDVLGPGHMSRRILVLLAAAMWVAISVYSYLPDRLTNFTQTSCKRRPILTNFFLLTPITVGIYSIKAMPWLVIVVILPFAMLASAWIIAILLRRKDIWPGDKSRSRFSQVLLVIQGQFPFIHFLTAVILPFLYWVATIELGILNSNDNVFTLSFGQVLALFVTVQPMLQVAQLFPTCYHWFLDLTWIRRMNGRPKSRRFTLDGTESLISHEGKGRQESMYSMDDTASLASTNYELSMAEKRDDTGSRGNYGKI